MRWKQPVLREEDIHKAAAILHEYGPQEVVLTHRDGILVYDGRTYYEQKFYPEELVGRSGRGDTVIATYMAFRETHSRQRPSFGQLRPPAASWR